MCGVAGFVDFHAVTDLASGANILNIMSDLIAHRGPDDSGKWMDEQEGVFLAHRRLSINDLSSAGHQPMVSNSGRYVIVFNGEVYNFKKIKLQLEDEFGKKIAWQSNTDTEVLLYAIESWGIHKALNSFSGMFAFALWDTIKKELLIARDRVGEKPLYWGIFSNILIFGSELKACKGHPLFSSEIDRNALALFMQFGYIPAPHSIYRNIKKLKPGTFITISDHGKNVSLETYWHLPGGFTEKRKSSNVLNPFESVDKLEELITKSISLQIEADVPVGAFLSGGVDSSLVVALAQTQSAQSIKTFTVGFNETMYDESKFAKRVSRHLGTDHTEILFSEKEALDIIPRLPIIYCEPFADPSQIPTYLLSKVARSDVTVALSGDGGDELFFGYSRYGAGVNLAHCINSISPFLLANFSKLMLQLSPGSWDTMLRPFFCLSSKSKFTNLGEKIHKIAPLLNSKNLVNLYSNMISARGDGAGLVIGADDPLTTVLFKQDDISSRMFEKFMPWVDFNMYLPDDILVKVDRAAMSVGLETRIPFLQHEIVEFAFEMPQYVKKIDGHGKWPLRHILKKYLPSELINRPKMGFGVPIDNWLRGGLREWAESLLNENRLHAEGNFHPLLVRQKWQEHLSGQRNWGALLWNILMFQAWFEKQ